MSSNVYRDTTAADLLNQQRLDQQASKAAGKGANNFQPEHILQPDDTINITDSVVVNTGTSIADDTIDITDSVTVTTQNTGTFLIDTAKIGFSDIG